ncbi:hypothetical protein WICMUC_004840 [Wickerhamomyces mucosus]|uniref:Jacalin-type lectin domain-containing protein n=1 Tax=Wickerhamomyces mucosus TaxID=1378264 RepID=A0A9P8PF73_9ASCO|nr:hypothetical protein WICMUC_004840 [Wickerhamomyces mucosus]
MTLKFYNIQNKTTVHTPLFIIHGESVSEKGGFITVSHKHNAFPPLHYEVSDGFFKLVTHLDPGLNPLVISQYHGLVANGFPVSKNPPLITSTELSIYYQPLTQNQPIHLCLLIAKDSPATFDTTSIKKQQEGNDLNLAIKKLRVAGRLMQAYTNEQMLRAGFGNRTFNFVEEETNDTQFFQENESVIRNTIKIHVLRSRRTLSEIRDPNAAQQNEQGSRRGQLFDFAGEALRDYGAPFSTATPETPVQAAVLLLDSHWDKKLNLILAHAALGGGDNKLRLAIFGSHGVYSWPAYYEQIVPAFQDTTRSDINEVANDSNECSSYWECLNITNGAFMHEIGHLIGSPHQTYGIMLRDYITLNRSFVSREAICVRTGSQGKSPILPADECKWHRLDLLRFLYHPSFSLPSDSNDPSFGKDLKISGKPVLLPLGNSRALLTSETGIYAIEIYKGDLAYAFIEFLPLSLGGQGPQKEINISYNDLKSRLPQDKQEGDYEVHALSIDGNQSEFREFHKLINDDSNFIHSDFGLGRGQLTAIKSGVFGDINGGSQIPIVIFDPERVISFRIYWGHALDGIRVNLSEHQEGPPPVPVRDYKSSGGLKSFFKSTVSSFTSTIRSTVLFGNETGNFTDFSLEQGEKLSHFKIRSGAWVDAIQIITDRGRSSPMLGNTAGGGEGSLSVPHDYEIIGFYGSKGDWLDSIGVIYTHK